MTDRIHEEAAAWLAAQGDDRMDWDGFTAWLEASPAHRDAFDAVAMIDAEVGDHREAIARLLPPAVERSGPAQRWTIVGAGAVAAALALVIGVPMMRAPTVEPMVYRTGTGQSRAMALADGARVILASASTLTVAGEAQDNLTLQGSAYFDVPHRAGRTLLIHAGGYTVSDIGTRFAVSAGRTTVRVEVAQGELTVRSKHLARPAQLVGGHQLIGDDRRGTVRLAAIASSDVASWRAGQLRYSAAPLSLVADDLSRYTGQTVLVEPALADRAFTGVLDIGDGSRLVGAVADIMALKVDRSPAGVRLVARPRP